MDVKKEWKPIILLLSSATSLKPQSNPTLFVALFEQIHEVIFVDSLHTVLSQFSTPQNTTYRKKARFWNTKKIASVVYFNGSAKMPSFNFLRKSLLC